MLGVLLEQGMNVARLNFSHGDHETHARTIGRLKEALAKRPGLHCAVMLDTKGPEIRTGFFVLDRTNRLSGVLFCDDNNDRVVVSRPKKMNAQKIVFEQNARMKVKSP